MAQGKFKDVPLCVLTAYAFTVQHQQRQEHEEAAAAKQQKQRAPQQKQQQAAAPPPAGRVDEQLGVLTVPDSLAAAEVYRTLAALGGEVQRSMRVNRCGALACDGAAPRGLVAGRSEVGGQLMMRVVAAVVVVVCRLRGDEAAALMARVRRALRLRELTRDGRLAEAHLQVRGACVTLGSCGHFERGSKDAGLTRAHLRRRRASVCWRRRARWPT